MEACTVKSASTVNVEPADIGFAIAVSAAIVSPPIGVVTLAINDRFVFAPLLEEERDAGCGALIAQRSAQSGCIGRAPGPLSPPTMTQSSTGCMMSSSSGISLRLYQSRKLASQAGSVSRQQSISRFHVWAGGASSEPSPQSNSVRLMLPRSGSTLANRIASGVASSGMMRSVARFWSSTETPSQTLRSGHSQRRMRGPGGAAASNSGAATRVTFSAPSTALSQASDMMRWRLISLDR